MPLVCGLLVLDRAVVDVLEREMELCTRAVRDAAILAAAVGRHAQQLGIVPLTDVILRRLR
jgi:uncharacterized protein with ATP-grasp and redox domains